MINKKIYIVSAICLAVGGILWGIGALFGGQVYGMSMDGSGIRIYSNKTLQTSDNDRMVSDKIELDAFDAMEIDVEFADCSVIASDHYGVEYQLIGRYVPEIKVEGQKLIVQENTSKLGGDHRFFSIGFTGDVWTDADPAYVKIYVPENYEGTDISMNVSSGNINLDSLSAEKITIEDSFGDLNFKTLEFDTLTVRNESGDIDGDTLRGREASLESEFGDIHVKTSEVSEMNYELSSGNMELDAAKGENLTVNSEFGDVNVSNGILNKRLDVETDSGNCTLTRVAAENIEIEVSFGNVQMEMEKPKEYNMELTTEFGEIRVEGQECGSSYEVKNDDTEKQIVINNSSGDIVINSVD